MGKIVVIFATDLCLGMVMERFEAVLNFWFGSPEVSDLPTQERTQLWFGQDSANDKLVKEMFETDTQKAAASEYKSWQDSARGSLGLIVLLDQFPRRIYRNTKHAYDFDKQALKMCTDGVNQELEHGLSLIERAFYYMPLAHAEDIKNQTRSVAAFQSLVEYSMPEVSAIFEKLLEFSVIQFQVIEKFGRFPARNEVLGRKSTDDELKFLGEMKGGDQPH